jgi:hypothetical protein
MRCGANGSKFECVLSRAGPVARQSNRCVFVRFPSDPLLRKSFLFQVIRRVRAPLIPSFYLRIAEAGKLHLPRRVEEADGCLRAGEKIFPVPIAIEVPLPRHADKVQTSQRWT